MTILVPVDGSEAAARAVGVAGRMAGQTGERVVVVSVVPLQFGRDVVSQLEGSNVSDEQSFARRWADDAVAVLSAAGVEAEARVLEGVPGQVILDQISRERPRAVVMGHRSQDQLFPEGSLSRRVANTGVELHVVD